MARIKQTKTASPGILVPIIVVIYKTDNVAAEYDRLVLPTPHTGPEIYEFSDVDPGVYLVKHYASSDGVTLETLLKDFFCDSTSNQVLSERLFYLVDGPGEHDPVSVGPNNAKIIDPYFDGKNITGVFREGFRYLKPAIEWTQAGDQLQLLNGITNSGSELWSVEITYSVIAVSQGQNDSFADIIVVSDAALTLGSTQYNKTVIGQTLANKQVLTLPLIGTVPDGRGYNIRHGRGNAINVVIKAQAGETIVFMGLEKNQITLGIGERVKIVKKAPYWYVIDEFGMWARRGEFVGWFSQLRDNHIPLLGGEYDPVTYVSLGEFVDSLDGSLVVDYATFNSNVTINGEVVYHKRGFFAKDAGTGKIRVPDLSNKYIRYLKNVGGADASRNDNIPGGYQHWAVGPHPGGLVPHVGAGGNVEGYGPGNAPGADNFDVGSNGSTGATENIVRNIGLIPLLCL